MTVILRALSEALVLTLIIELVIAAFFAKRGKKVLLWCAFGNVLTNPLLNMILFIVNPIGDILYYLVAAMCEIGAFLFEAFVYENLAQMTKKRAHLLSLTANALSLGIGFLLAFLF